MDVTVIIGIGGVLVGAFLPMLNVPVPVAAAGVTIGFTLIVYGMLPVEMRPTPPQLFLYAAGFALIGGTAVWQLTPRPKVSTPPEATASATPVAASAAPADRPVHAPPHGQTPTNEPTVHVGAVTSVNQKGGVTAGYVGNVTQGPSGE